VQRIGNFLGNVMPSPGVNTPSKEASAPIAQGQASVAQRSAGQAPSSPYTDRKGPPRKHRLGVATDFALIKGILAKALAGKGLDRKIDRYEFILHWDKIVGEKLAEVSRPEYISRRALIVRVMHPVWAQELTFMKAHLLRKLAPYLKRGDLVEDMIFRVGPLAE